MKNNYFKSRRRLWLWPQGRNECKWNRLLLVFLMLFMAVTGIKADGYITDLIVLGEYYESDLNTLVNDYKKKGYTFVNKDLNDGAGGWYIKIGYKTSTTANPETGYVTDIIASTKDVDSFKEGGRTYTKIPRNSGYSGNMNRGCSSGTNMWLYYTMERTNLTGWGAQKRCITSLYTSDSPSNAKVLWCQSGDLTGACDLNHKAGGDYIYLIMNFANQKLSITNHPTVASNLTYNGKSQLLIPNAPTGNYGTMYYKVNDGSYSTSLPSATNVGNYTAAIDITKATYNDANLDVTFVAGTPVAFEITKKTVMIRSIWMKLRRVSPMLTLLKM